MKKLFLLLLLVLLTVSCKDPVNEEVLNINVSFHQIENEEFSRAVEGKEFMSPLVNNKQTLLSFSHNKLTVNTYALTKERNYSTYNILFSEDLTYMGLSRTSYFDTDINGLSINEGYYMSEKPLLTSYSVINSDSIVLNDVPFFTEKEFNKKGLKNYIKDISYPYQKRDNPSFDSKVKDITFYTSWFPLIQSSLQFDTVNKTARLKQYYTSHYDASRDENDPPAYNFDNIYIREYDYMFNEDLSSLALTLKRHYRTNMNGRVIDEFTDFCPSMKTKEYSFTDTGVLIWDYEKYYTYEYMKAHNIPNYIVDGI